jgi:hypothetical protein
MAGRYLEGMVGDDPPFHGPVFVLTNHARGSLTMKGGTTFYFVTNGIQDALTNAREAAEGKDIRLGGGIATIREYFRAGRVDEMPFGLFARASWLWRMLLAGRGLPALGYQVDAPRNSANCLHVTIAKKGV